MQIILLPILQFDLLQVSKYYNYNPDTWMTGMLGSGFIRCLFPHFKTTPWENTLEKQP